MLVSPYLSIFSLVFMLIFVASCGFELVSGLLMLICSCALWEGSRGGEGVGGCWGWGIRLIFAFRLQLRERIKFVWCSNLGFRSGMCVGFFFISVLCSVDDAVALPAAPLSSSAAAVVSSVAPRSLRAGSRSCPVLPAQLAQHTT